MNVLQPKEAEIEALKSQIKKKEDEIASLKKQNEWYIEQLKLRQKEKFGVSSEKADENKMTLFDFFNEAEILCQPIAAEPDEEEIRSEFKIVAAKVSILEHLTYVYRCRNCDKNGTEGFIKKSDSPKAMIPKSMVFPSMIAYILNQKYTNAMPLYRQEQEFRRYGIGISHQNLSNWIIKGARLLKPLMLEMKKELLENELLHADETILEVLHEPGRPSTSKSYMWVYRTSVSTEHPVILYDYQEGQRGAHARAFLKEWKGRYIHCDGYAGYKQLEASHCVAVWFMRNGNFLKDGRIQLSNNLAEQSVKPFVIGRKNWLFANTPNGASASSLIYSVIQTAISNDLKPMAYLEYVFEQIQLTKEIQHLLP